MSDDALESVRQQAKDMHRVAMSDQDDQLVFIRETAQRLRDERGRPTTATRTPPQRAVMPPVERR